MKKTITFLSLFIGLTSQAQYINHARFVVEASAGYSFAFGLNKSLDYNTPDVDFQNETSGLIVEIGAYYRAGFDSRNLFGIKANQVNGKSMPFYSFSNPMSIYSVDKESSLTFIGPSYRREATSISGNFTVAATLTPGIMLLETKMNEYNSSSSMKSTGFAFNLSFSNGYTIVESLQATFNVGLDFGRFNKFTVDAPKGTYYEKNNPFEQRKDIFRVNLSLGLRYKL